MDSPENSALQDPNDIVPKSQEEVDRLGPTEPWPNPTYEQKVVYEQANRAARRLWQNGELLEQNRALIESSLTDHLTGLLNRIGFKHSVEAQLRDEPGPYALVAIDLGNFKQINDTLGHPKGDAVLFNFGSRLRASDIIGASSRFGGDEFFVLGSLRPRDDQKIGVSLTPNKRLEVFEDRLHQFGDDMRAEDPSLPKGFNVAASGIIYDTTKSYEENLAAADAALHIDKQRQREKHGRYR